MDLNLEKEKLGQLLLSEEVISEDELEQALEFQENVGGKLGEIIVKLGFSTNDELIDVIAKQQNMDTIDLSNLVLPEDLIKEVPEELIEKHEVIPVSLQGDTLELAIHNPFDLASIEEIELATNHRVIPRLAPREQILKAINELYYSEDAAGDQELQELREDLDELEMDTDELVKRLIIMLVRNNVVSREDLEEEIYEQEEE